MTPPSSLSRHAPARPGFRTPSPRDNRQPTPAPPSSASPPRSLLTDKVSAKPGPRPQKGRTCSSPTWTSLPATRAPRPEITCVKRLPCMPWPLTCFPALGRRGPPWRRAHPHQDHLAAKRSYCAGYEDATPAARHHQPPPIANAANPGITHSAASPQPTAAWVSGTLKAAEPVVLRAVQAPPAAIASRAESAIGESFTKRVIILRSLPLVATVLQAEWQAGLPRRCSAATAPRPLRHGTAQLRPRREDMP
jgi:hypothetical protein